MSSKSKQSDWWQNRIVQHGVAPASSFLAHEMNARRHPAKQREALRGSLDSLGWIAPVVVSAKTGKMLDGHARIEEALSRDEMMGVPFVEVEVSEDEERLILATLDPISALATYDKEALDSLLRDVSIGNEAMQQLLTDLAETVGVIPPSSDQWGGVMGDLPDGDRAPFQQMTFTLTDTQAAQVKEALARAQSGEFGDTGNANSNGNALACICEAYIDGRG